MTLDFISIHVILFSFFIQHSETKSTLPLSSDHVTVSPGTESRRESAQNASQDGSGNDGGGGVRNSVQQLQRESGDGASANPTENESTNAYQRRAKTRTGSLFDDDDEDENVDDDNENGGNDATTEDAGNTSSTTTTTAVTAETTDTTTTTTTSTTKTKQNKTSPSI